MYGKVNISDDLLVKYLLLEVNDTEQSAVDQWIAVSKENQQYFEHFRTIWECSKQLAATSTVDENAAWERLQARILQQKQEMPSAPVRIIPFIKLKWARIAAILVILLGSGALFYAYDNRTITIQSEGTVLVETLPDGSVVTLNKQSSLSYPHHFKGNKRAVQLSGEGFFNITPDKQKPFIIDANGLDIKVVGTSFNVKSTPQRTEVIVETGIVEVRKQTRSVSLHPQEKAVVLSGDRTPVKEKNEDALYNYYRTNEFVCNNTPLWRLVDVLNEAYNVHIVISEPGTRNAKMTTTFRNEQLDNILAVICETLNLKADKKGEEIILK